MQWLFLYSAIRFPGSCFKFNLVVLKNDFYIFACSKAYFRPTYLLLSSCEKCLLQSNLYSHCSVVDRILDLAWEDLGSNLLQREVLLAKIWVKDDWWAISKELKGKTWSRDGQFVTPPFKEGHNTNVIE